MFRRDNARHSNSRRCLIEAVEGRRMMSVVPVTNLNNAGVGSLRAAIASAVAGDTIDLSGISGTIVTTGGQISIDKSLTLLGADETHTVISGGGTIHPFVINAGSTVTMTDLTITDGITDTSGGAILNRGMLTLDNVTISDSSAFLFGGGIYSSGGSLTLNNTTISGNTAQGALEASGGGLYMNGGTLTVNGSTFSGNTAIGKSNTGLLIASGLGTGGGIFLNNTADSTITNSTFGDNSAQGGTTGALALNASAYGGAIYTSTTNGTLLNHVTIAYNSAAGGGNALQSTLATSQGGGVYSAQSTTGVTMEDSISALNAASAQPDVMNTLTNSLGNNLIGIYGGINLVNDHLGDLLGTIISPLSPGISATLADNGGDTATFALDTDSPALDTASPSTSPALDQRGLGRRNAPDMGAFELDANHLPVIAAPSIQAVGGSAYSQAIATADADGDTVTVTSPNLPGFLSLQSVNGVTSLVGNPTEADAGTYKIELDAFDGFQTVTTSFKFKVGIVGIDLNQDTGLLRLNGTEFNDVLSVKPLKSDPSMVRVYRNGFARTFAVSAIKKIQVFGFEGDDDIYINAGPGIRASISAGDGNDTVTGGDGNDYISGGAGNDIIHGGGGRDRIDGDAGRDKIFGDSGIDTLHGGDGNDYVDGGSGQHNRLFGDDGDDMLVSTGIKDVVDGGLGTNTGSWSKLTTVIDAVLSDK